MCSTPIPVPRAPAPRGPGTSLFDVRVCPDEQAAWARVAAVLEQADRPVVTAHLRRGDVHAAARAYNATPGGHTRIEVTFTPFEDHGIPIAPADLLP